MSNTEVTVLMPVYNGAKYIKAAIDSILNQTLKQFELLIIDDHSTDRSVEMIKQFSDPRIRLLVHQHNLGLIRTLNIGLNEAKGKYVARMDQDDIAHPQRLQLQTNYLEQHPTCGVIASTVTLINSNGVSIGNWTEDIQYQSASAIKNYLPFCNCIAHPTIMARVALLRQYHYTASPNIFEDYDLWLRLTADGIRIDKIAQPLLSYRMHADSMTQQARQKQVGSWQTISTKGRFLWRSFRQFKINYFIIRVAWRYSKDLVWWLLHGR